MIIGGINRVRQTRVAGIGYTRICRSVWQPVDLDGMKQVGPQYATERELLACVDGWADRQGYGK